MSLFGHGGILEWIEIWIITIKWWEMFHTARRSIFQHMSSFFAFVGFCLRIWIDISIFYLLQNDYRQECPGCLLQRQALGFCWRLFSRLWNCQIYLNLLNTECSPVAEHIFHGLKTPSNGRFLQCAPPPPVMWRLVYKPQRPVRYKYHKP